MTYEEYLKASPEEKEELKKRIKKTDTAPEEKRLEIETTLKVLKKYAERLKWDEETYKCLKEAHTIIASECERDIDQEAHAEVTLEMEQGKNIPLAEWARKNGVNPDNARQRATRGTLPAEKVGGIWMINEFVENKTH